MNHTNDTNMFVTGSGTATDPYTYHFHTTGHALPHLAAYTFWIGIIIGFCLGYLCFKLLQKRKSNQDTKS